MCLSASAQHRIVDQVTFNDKRRREPGSHPAGAAVELFFKWIKENLKIRSFLGHSLNAVALQIFVVLCGYLLVASKSSSRVLPWTSRPSYAWSK